MKRPTLITLAACTPYLFLAAVIAGFAAVTPGFLTLGNLGNTLTQASSTGIIAVGMTFVLITGGVDLSVGAVMFIGAAVCGKLLVANEVALPLVLGAMFATVLAFGCVNATLVARFRLIPFVVTLATLYFGRGLALWLTGTRAMNLPEAFLGLGSASWLGIPAPVWTLAAVACLGHAILKLTPFGRQVYAVGESAAAASKAGIHTQRVLFSVYLISAACAGLAAVVSLTQLGAVSPTFGLQKEFAAIAAAVLGGTSLFGGRGGVLPGTLVGTLLIQTVENGLVHANADPYVYPIATAGIVFAATLGDSLRACLERQGQQPRIRPRDLRPHNS